MEGGRRGAALAATLLAGCALIVGANGCGGEDESSAVGPNAVQTANPERTFAPLLEVAPDEPWRPVGARWFVERSLLGVSGCENRPIAVGRTMPEQRNEATDWIFLDGLGRSARSYYRNPYDARCELDSDRRLYADQLTRPRDPGPRLDGLSSDQGFYLDLEDEQRGGPPLGAEFDAPVYVERVDEGDSGVRLTYWTLYGMHGSPGDPIAHEGDWERVDVLLRADGDRYEPLAVQAPTYGSSVAESETGEGAAGSDFTETAWSAVGRVDGTHPVVRVAREIHDMIPFPPGVHCSFCRRWRTWDTLEDARDQLWYGFGGAWGEVGPTSETTGPLGPHGHWPTVADKEIDIADG